MPPRLATVAIILCWLATTSVLIYREAALRFRSGEPPPFTIDLTDEVSASVVQWNVIQMGRPIGKGSTQVKRQSDGTFEFSAEFNLDKFKIPIADLKELKSINTYTVTEEGQLRAASAKLKLRANLPVWGDTSAEIDFKGEVHDHQFHPRLVVVVAGNEVPPFPLEPFPVSESGSILNPMHLVHKISGLREGQTWPIQLLDPLRAMPAVRDLLPAKGLFVNKLIATVTLEDREWQGAMVPCFKIEYAKPDELPLAATWVRRRDAVVLEQWAGYEGIEYTLQRAPGQ